MLDSTDEFKLGEIKKGIDDVSPSKKEISSASEILLKQAIQQVSDRRSNRSLESIEITERVQNPYEEYLGGVESDEEKKLDYVKTFKDPVSHEEFKYREVKWLEGKETND